jgi:hypothetical protein
MKLTSLFESAGKNWADAHLEPVLADGIKQGDKITFDTATDTGLIYLIVKSFGDFQAVYIDDALLMDIPEYENFLTEHNEFDEFFTFRHFSGSDEDDELIENAATDLLKLARRLQDAINLPRGKYFGNLAQTVGAIEKLLRAAIVQYQKGVTLKVQHAEDEKMHVELFKDGDGQLRPRLMSLCGFSEEQASTAVRLLRTRYFVSARSCNLLVIKENIPYFIMLGGVAATIDVVRLDASSEQTTFEFSAENYPGLDKMFPGITTTIKNLTKNGEYINNYLYFEHTTFNHFPMVFLHGDVLSRLIINRSIDLEKLKVAIPKAYTQGDKIFPLQRVIKSSRCC